MLLGLVGSAIVPQIPYKGAMHDQHCAILKRIQELYFYGFILISGSWVKICKQLKTDNISLFVARSAQTTLEKYLDIEGSILSGLWSMCKHVHYSEYVISSFNTENLSNNLQIAQSEHVA